jgi:glycosidase
MGIGLIFCLSMDCMLAQDTIAVYPSCWWIGMKDPTVQLMIHAPGIARNTVRLSLDYPGVRLVRYQRLESPNYLFADLLISSQAQPGLLQFHFLHQGGVVQNLRFRLKARRPGNGSSFAQGVTAADLIYLIMPDRFANGDSSNDRIPGMRDQSLDRDSIFLRHGGDLQGITRHLDYLQDLGITTLWLTPVLENDMPNRTEHGYAITNHYRVDPRLGGAAAYQALIDSLHRRGMKIIQDAVYNHVGLYHFLVQDLPARDWLNQWPAFTQTSYRDQPLMDSHGSAYDQHITSDGWFTRQMPDLNQRNPFLAHYLIQQAIWSVEEFGVDGWRIDTYIYCDLNFMNRCNAALIREYPRISMFGEAWVHGTANEAYFARNNLLVPFKSNLMGVTDFQCNFYGILPALTQATDWNGGVNRLYSTLANDFLYQDPMRNLIFLDNHDLSRFYSVLGEDLSKLKIGIAWLLTCRGIPELYYGTELLMKGLANPDGLVRKDFPGGWPGDPKNAFTGQGLTAEEKELWQFVRTLARFRAHCPAIQTGRMMQFLPVHGVYVYFRYSEKQTIMCIMNPGDAVVNLDMSRYAERTAGYQRAADVLGSAEFSLSGTQPIPARTMLVLELRP